VSTEVHSPLRSSHDLRLASAAGVAWLAVAVGIGWSAPATAWLAVSLFVVALCGLRLAPDRRVWRVIAFVCAVTAALTTDLALRLQAVQGGSIARLADAHASVEIEVVLLSDPHDVARSSGGTGPPQASARASVVAVAGAGTWHHTSGSVVLLAPAQALRGLLPGQRLRATVTLLPARSGSLTAAIAEARGSPVLMGRPPWWQRAAGQIRADLRDACQGLPSSVRGLLPGVVDGDTSQMDPVLAQRFKTAGLSHITAVSGANLSIAVAALTLVLSRFGASPRLRAVVGALAVLAFVVVARPSASVLRAAAMAGITLAGTAAGRPRQVVPMVAAAVLTLLGWKPELARDLGFTLSVCATLALVTIAPPWAAALARRGVPACLAESFATASAAHLATTPVIVALSGQLSLVAIPANVLAEPVVAPATVAGLGAALLSTVVMPFGRVCAQFGGLACRWLVADAEFFSSIPGGACAWASGWAGAATTAFAMLLFAVAVLRRRVRLITLAACAAAVVVQIPIRSVVVQWPMPGWIFTVCDVGQGDGLVLSTRAGGGGHEAVVIDAGPDPVVMDRCLSDLSIQRVPLLVFTHDHLDHVGGVLGVLHTRSLGRVLMSPLADPAAGVRLVADSVGRLGAPEVTAKVGQNWIVGVLRLDVLGPLRPAHGTRSDPNNSSVILRASIPGLRLLLPGDAEVEEQDDVLSADEDIRADVLKVPHHGSAWSDSAFLAAVHARLAIVSVGLNNDYGHPAPSLLATMARLGVPLLRTDRDGDVAVARRDGRVQAVVRRHHRPQAAGTSLFPDNTAVESARHRVLVSVPAEGPWSPRISFVAHRSDDLETMCLTRHEPSARGPPSGEDGVVASSCDDVRVSTAAAPKGLVPLTLVTGDEDYLVSRTLDDLRRLVRDTWSDAELYEFDAASLDTVELMQLLSPSLFGGQRLVVLRNAQDLPAGGVDSVVTLVNDLDEGTFVVVQHPGAAKGKALLEALRKSKPLELTCAKITKPDERQAFVREEVRRLKGKITPDGAAAVLDAVGSDLREIAAAIAQLLGDNGGVVDADAVAAYHRGRAEVTGFVVAEHAVTGNVNAALTNLRWALNIGVAPVLIADALADGVRSVARVMAAGPGDPFKLAPILGMPPWKVKKSRSQAQGWTESGLQQSLQVVATLNAQVKGTAADSGYALESAIRAIGGNRRASR